MAPTLVIVYGKGKLRVSADVSADNNDECVGSSLIYDHRIDLIDW